MRAGQSDPTRVEPEEGGTQGGGLQHPGAHAGDPEEVGLALHEQVVAGRAKKIEAALRISLISSTLVSRSATKHRSTAETLIVGTRMEKPSSLPFSSGSTRPTAFAAPVLVGICDIVAERARRRSL